MDVLINGIGFLGAWLLVAGPARQAVIELEEEQVDRAAMEHLKDTVERPEPISLWWWLIPPVAFVKQRRLSAAYREAVLAALPSEVVAQFGHYVDKATGWMLVAGGALLIAVKETWELTHASELEPWAFWALLLVPLLVTLGVTVSRARVAASTPVVAES